MALDPREEHVIRQIEQELEKADPRLARRMLEYRPRGRWVYQLLGPCLVASATALWFVSGAAADLAYRMAGVLLFLSGWCLARSRETLAGPWVAGLHRRPRLGRT